MAVLPVTEPDNVRIKDPDAVLDFGFDWTPWLAPLGDVIISVSWEAVGVEAQPLYNTDGVVMAMVSGGTVGEPAWLRCRITTLGGRKDDRTMRLKIVER